MSYWLGCIFIYLLFLQDASHGLRLVEVRIPNYVIKGSAAQLECLYDLDGEALYSVKWYKDGNEFYRYVPRDMPPAQTFLLPGVSVDLHNSSDAIVTLRSVNLQSAGRFRCEVSGEAPSFQTVTEHGDMIVVSLPDQGPPKISGGRPRYQIGDWVRINCTAGRSKPSVQLTWFVNGEPAEPHMLRKYDTIVSGREGLETSVLGLQFRVDQHHFRNGDMKLKCVASLSTFYWRSNEESVEGDRPQKAPVLESRETVYASNSRADPVQASRTDSVVVANAPGLLMLLLPVAIVVCGCLEQLHFMQHLFVRQILCQRQQQLQQQQQYKQQQNQKQQQQQERLTQEQQQERLTQEQQQLKQHQNDQQHERLEQQTQTKRATVDVVASTDSSSSSNSTSFTSSSFTSTAAVASSPLLPMFGNERRLQPAPQLTRVSAANMSSSTSSSSSSVTSVSTSLLSSSSLPLSSPPSPSSLLLLSSSSSSPSSLLSLSLCALLSSSMSTSSQAATRQGALGAR